MLVAFVANEVTMIDCGEVGMCLEIGRGLEPYLGWYRPWSCAYHNTLSRSLEVLGGSLRLGRHLPGAFRA